MNTLLQAIVVASLSWAAEQYGTLLVDDIRENAGQAAEVCQARGACEVIVSNVKEFSNDNTFVQLKTDVSNRTVELVLPTQMSANGFFEALIKIRTYKTEGAREVRVTFAAGPLSAPLRKGLWGPWLKVAGADNIIWPSGMRPARLAKPAVPTERITQSLVTDMGHSHLAATIAQTMELEVYSSSEVATMSHKQIFLVSSASAQVNAHFLKTLDFIQELKKNGNEVVLISPYFPYSRSDKIDQAGVTATAKLVADLIEAAGTDALVTTRLHAPQVQGFFNIPTIHVSGRTTIDNYLEEQKIDAIISPDAGFQKEATLYAERIGLPVYVLNKQRDPITGQSKLMMMGSFDLKGQRVAIIDDETASGGTLGSAAQFLKEVGQVEYVIGAVTHLAGNAQNALDNPFLDEVAVTNTFPVQLENKKAVVLEIGHEIGKKAKRLSLAQFHQPSSDPCRNLLSLELELEIK